MSDLTGQSIGRYRITEKLGRGGMAMVYKAYDTRLERDVAFKVIRTENIPPAQLDTLMQRFEREAKAQAKFDHPHIVPIHDFGEHEGAPFLVMPYRPGGTLKDYTGRQMPYQHALNLLAPVADALAYAQARGVFHRDVKPSNILMSEEGVPALADFGIAKLLETDQDTLTGTGVGIGTPEYMSPEQWRGTTVPQTDIYALGVVLFELVTGQKPYTADTPAAILIMQVNDPLPPPTQFVPGLPEQVEKLIYKSLAVEPEDRYETMNEFADAMRACLAGEPTLKALAKPEPVERTKFSRTKPAGSERDIPPDTVDMVEEPPEEKRAKRKIPGWVWGLAAGVVVITALVLFAVFGDGGAPAAQAPAAQDPAVVEESAIVYGTEDNPLVWAVVPQDEMDASLPSIEEIIDRISTETGILVEAVTVSSYVEVVDMLCSGEAQMGVLNAFNYIYASSRGCAEVRVGSIRFETSRSAGQFIACADTNIRSIADLEGAVFCYPGPFSVSGWTLQRLTMQAEGIDPEAYFGELIESGPHTIVVEQVYNCECDAGSTFVDARNNVDFEDVMGQVVVIAETAPMPHDSLSFHPSVGKDQIEAVTDILFELSKTEEGLELLRSFIYNTEGLDDQIDGSFDELRGLIEASGEPVEDLIE